MKDSRFQHNHRYLVPRKAHGYEPLEEGGYLLADSTLDVVGSGGMYTTVLDLTKWARNFRDNQLDGGVDTIAEMQVVGELQSGEKTDYGLGIGIREYRGLPIRAHGGALRGYRTYLMMFPEQAFSIALLCNDQQANTGDIVRAVAEIYLADEFTAEAPSDEESPDETAEAEAGASLASVDLAAYEGSYYSREVDGTQLLVMNELGLALAFPAGALPLDHVSDDKFGSSDYGFELVFERGSSGDVSSFTYNGSRAAGVVFRRVGSE